MRNRRRPPRKPKPREARKTVLLIGEGDTEVFFLKHIMKPYNSRGCGVACTVRCAHGKGPEHILALPSRCEKTADYDHKAVLLDSDIPLPEKNEAEARSQGVELLLSTPCLEGLLLGILRLPLPNNSRQCKRAIKQLSIDLLRRDSYQRYFPKSLLDDRRGEVLTLQRVIEIASGTKLFPEG